MLKNINPFKEDGTNKSYDDMRQNIKEIISSVTDLNSIDLSLAFSSPDYYETIEEDKKER